MKTLDIDIVEKLYFWQHNRTECFSDHLFDLFKKADHVNVRRLASAFPGHYAALMAWEEAGNYGEDLFKKYGLVPES